MSCFQESSSTGTYVFFMVTPIVHRLLNVGPTQIVKKFKGFTDHFSHWGYRVYLGEGNAHLIVHSVAPP